ncbi:hypothetical protein LZ32DRAFT_38214 [Colletotrichum eremochloae]|nr:hypothetical protein LZ32DRAFT_38214 [Colletotrichum eremochloae]
MVRHLRTCILCCLPRTGTEPAAVEKICSDEMPRPARSFVTQPLGGGMLLHSGRRWHHASALITAHFLPGFVEFNDCQATSEQSPEPPPKRSIWIPIGDDWPPEEPLFIFCIVPPCSSLVPRFSSVMGLLSQIPQMAFRLLVNDGIRHQRGPPRTVGGKEDGRMADEEAPPGMWLSKGTKSPVFQMMRRAAHGHRGNVDGVLQHYLPSFPRIRPLLTLEA